MSESTQAQDREVGVQDMAEFFGSPPVEATGSNSTNAPEQPRDRRTEIDGTIVWEYLREGDTWGRAGFVEALRTEAVYQQGVVSGLDTAVMNLITIVWDKARAEVLAEYGGVTPEQVQAWAELLIALWLQPGSNDKFSQAASEARDYLAKLRQAQQATLTTPEQDLLTAEQARRRAYEGQP